MGYDVGGEGEQVGVFRKCACETVIMAFCRDRRDISELGLERRRLFGELMERMVGNGWGANEARQRLLEALRAPDAETAVREATLHP